MLATTRTLHALSPSLYKFGRSTCQVNITQLYPLLCPHGSLGVPTIDPGPKLCLKEFTFNKTLRPGKFKIIEIALCQRYIYYVTTPLYVEHSYDYKNILAITKLLQVYQYQILHQRHIAR